MSQTIKLKRSALTGKVPTTGNIDLGELAINTTDGKIFFKKDDGAETIQTILTTNAEITGALYLSGSLTASEALIGPLTFPTTDGSAGQFLKTDGAGNIGFIDGVSFPYTGSAIISSSLQITGSSSVTGSLTINDYTFPLQDGTINQIMFTDGAGNMTFDFLRDIYVEVKNVDGSTLSKGTPVHVSGSTGNTNLVVAASASDATKMPATFILNEQLDPDQEGLGIAVGFINGVNTSGFTEGDVVYVGESGGYTNVKPTGTNLIQNLGIVTKVDASNGSGYVLGAGRTNAVPNLLNGEVFFGEGNTAIQKPLSDILSGSSYVYSGSFSGSFEGDGSGLTGVGGIFTVSGSDVDNNQFDSEISVLQFDSSTGLNVSQSAAGTAFISIGSHYRDIVIDGQTTLVATGSDQLEFVSGDGITLTTSMTDTNANSVSKEVNFAVDNTVLRTTGDGVISSSAQIATEISGAFTSTSESIESTITSISSSFDSERLKNTTDTLTGDLTVTGKITAQEFHTEFVSSSIIYESGSTKFGDTSDDVHSFTGSLEVQGGITGSLLGTATTASYVEFTNIDNKPTLLSGSAQIATEISGAFTSTSSSIASDISTNDGRLDTLEGKTLVSSSAQIDHDQTINFSADEHFTQANITTVGTVTSGDVSAILPSGTVSSSAQLESTFDTRYLNTTGDSVVSSSNQIATEISGAFSSTSSSIASDINSLVIDSGSFSTRVTTNETNISNLQTASGSFSTRVSTNESNISNLQTDSGSFSTRVTTNETSISTLEGKTLVSSSAQIDHDQTTNFSADEHFTQANITTVGTVTSGDITGILPSGTVSGSSQINADSITNFDTNVKDKMNTDGVISSSIQVDHDQTTNFSADEHFTQANITTVGTVTAGNITAILPAGTVSSSAQIDHDQTTNFSADEHFTQANITTVGTVTSGDVSAILPSGTVSGSSQVSYTGLSNIPSGIVSSSAQIDHDQTTNFSSDEHFTQANITTVGTVTAGNVTAILPSGTVSSSAQIDHDQTTNFSADEHFTQANITTVGTVTAGNVTAILPSGTVSSSAQIDHDQTTNFSEDEHFTQGNITTVGTVTAGNVTAILPSGVVSSSAEGDGQGQIKLNGVNINTNGLGTDDSPQFTNLTLSGDLTVNGTTTTVNSTEVEIGDRIIVLNGQDAAGDSGINVYDTATNETGSLLWDTTGNYWKGGLLGSEVKFLRTTGDSIVSSSAQIDHDQTTNFSADEHFTQANITTVGTVTAGNVTAILPAGTVSSSAQIDHDQTTNFSSDEHFTQANITTVGTVTAGNVTAILPSGVVSSSAQLEGTFDTRYLNTTGDSVVSSSAQIDHDQTTNFSADEHFTQANITTVGTVTSGDVKAILPSGVVSSSAQLESTFDTRYLNTTGDSVVSSSAQISHDSTTGFVSNEHIDHSLVSITAGSGLTGGGTIAANRTINVGAGDGISVAADSVAVDSTVVRTSGNQTIGGTKTFSSSGTIVGTLTLGNNTTTNGALTMYLAAAPDTATMGVENVAGSAGFTMDSRLKVTGDILATGEVTAFASDDRLKNRISLLENPIEKIKQLDGFTYTWNEKAETLGLQNNGVKVGVSAQQVQAVLPEAVKPSPISKEYLTVQYEKLVPLLIESIKEQQNQIEKLQDEIEQLRNDVTR